MLGNKKIREYQIKVTGAEKALNDINRVEQALQRSNKVEARQVARRIAHEDYGVPLTNEQDLDSKQIARRVAQTRELRQSGNVTFRVSKGTEPVSAENFFRINRNASSRYGPLPSEGSYERQLQTSQGRRIPTISMGQISDRDLAHHTGVQFSRFLPYVLRLAGPAVKEVTDVTAKMVDQALSKIIQGPVSKTSSAQSFGLDFARQYVSLPGSRSYGSLSLKNPYGLSSWQLAFLARINQSAFPLTSTQLAQGNALMTGLGAVKQVSASGDIPQIWQRATQIMGGLQWRHLSDRIFRSVQLPPVAGLLMPSKRIELEMNQTMYRPHTITDLGKEVANVAGLNLIPGWTHVGSALPHKQSFRLRPDEVDLRWAPPPRKEGTEPTKYISYSGIGGLSLTPWTSELEGTANQFLDKKGGGIFARDIEEGILTYLQSGKRYGSRGVNYHDLSNIDIGFGQALNAFGDPAFVFGGPYTSGQKLVRKHLPQQENYAQTDKGQMAYMAAMYDFFTNPRLMKTLGSRSQAGEYAGILGKLIPQFAALNLKDVEYTHLSDLSKTYTQKMDTSAQVVRLADVFANIVKVAFPSAGAGSPRYGDRDIREFIRAIGGPDTVEAIQEVLVKAYDKAAESRDITPIGTFMPKYVPPGPLDTMPAYGNFQTEGLYNIIPHLLNALDSLVEYHKTGDLDAFQRYNPMPSSPNSKELRRTSKTEMDYLLGLSQGRDEGEPEVRSHLYNEPEEKIPFIKDEPHRYIDFSKGMFSPEKWAFASKVSKSTGIPVGDVLTSIARSGLSQAAPDLNEVVDLKKYHQEVMDDSLEESINLGPGETAQGGSATAPLTRSSKDILADLNRFSESKKTMGKERTPIPKKNSYLTKLLAIAAEGKKYMGIIGPMVAAAGLGLAAEHFMPGMGGIAGSMGGMLGMVQFVGADKNAFLSDYALKYGSAPEDAAGKQAYYDQANKVWESMNAPEFTKPETSAEEYTREQIAGEGIVPTEDLGRKANESAAQKTERLRNSSLYKKFALMSKGHLPGSNAAKIGFEAIYPMGNASVSQQQERLANLGKTVESIQKTFGGAAVATKTEASDVLGKGTTTHRVAASVSLAGKTPEEIEQTILNLAAIADESKAAAVFGTKSEYAKSIGGLSNISTTLGKRAGGAGSPNAMQVTGRFAFGADQMDQMKEVRQGLEGLGKDIKLTTYEVTEFNDAGEAQTKTFMEIDQNIPLDKTNAYGKSITESVKGIQNQNKGVEGSVKAMEIYDDAMVNSTTWTDTFLSRGKQIDKLSWKFTMLSLGALGVYFSMMGLVNMIKTGATALISPLGDLEGMIKNMAMSQAFGQGGAFDVGGAISGWQKMTGLVGDISTALAEAGAAILNDPEVWDAIQGAILSVKEFFANPENMQTVKDVFKGIAQSVQSLADNAHLVLPLFEAAATPIKEWPVVGPALGKTPIGDMSPLTAGILAAAVAAFAMVAGSIVSSATQIIGKGSMFVGTLGKGAVKLGKWLKGGSQTAEIVGDAAKAATGAAKAKVSPVSNAAKAVVDAGKVVYHKADTAIAGKIGGALHATVGPDDAVAAALRAGSISEEEAIAGYMAQGMSQPAAQAAAKAVGKRAGSGILSKLGGKLGGILGKGGGGAATIGLRAATGLTATTLVPAAIDYYQYAKNPEGYYQGQAEWYNMWGNLFTGGQGKGFTGKELQESGQLGLFGNKEEAGLPWWMQPSPSVPSQEELDKLTPVAPIPVNQDIQVTFIINGNMDKDVAQIAVTDLTELLKLYAKGNIGGQSS